MDIVKFVVAIAILVGAIGGYYMYTDVGLLFRVLGLVLAAAIAMAIAVTTEKGRFVWAFVGEARTEVRKVVWPSRNETVQTTLLVIVMVLLVAIFLYIVDLLLKEGVQLFIGGGGK